MSLMRVASIAIASLLLAGSVQAKNNTEIIFEKPANAAEEKIKASLQKSDVIDSMRSLIDDEFTLPSRLSFAFGADDGPLYDNEKNQILVPYAFVDEVRQRFSKAKYAESGVSIEDATQDAFMHTLFHEFAHALIYMHELPIVGKEEDAADELATILLINYFEDGQEVAISAADLFDLESDDQNQLAEDDFWDEHSLDAQRFYQTLCYVYGSDPKQYANLRAEAGFSADRAELCQDDYERASDSWDVLLEPFMKKKKKGS